MDLAIETETSDLHSGDLLKTYLKETKGKRIMPRDLIQLGSNDQVYSAFAVSNFLKNNINADKVMQLRTDGCIIIRARTPFVQVQYLILQPLKMRYEFGAGSRARQEVNFPEIKTGFQDRADQVIDRWYSAGNIILIWG